jgi:hypothetical protein
MAAPSATTSEELAHVGAHDGGAGRAADQNDAVELGRLEAGVGEGAAAGAAGAIEQRPGEALELGRLDDELALAATAHGQA